MYTRHSKENLVNIYTQWKFNSTLKTKVVSVGSLVEWLIQLTADEGQSIIMYFKDGKEGSKEVYIFRNDAVIWLFGISIFCGIILLCPLYHYTIHWQKKKKKPQQNPPETCNHKLFISEKTSRCPLVQSILTTLQAYIGPIRTNGN